MHPGKSFDNLGFAKVDLDRKKRQGISEVIYGEGKTTEHIESIIRSLCYANQKPVIITRLDAECAQECKKFVQLELHESFSYCEQARVGFVGNKIKVSGKGTIVVVSAGTSDYAISEEAALVAEILGNKVERIFDVGVAGIHRLMAYQQSITQARVIIVVAGMEGALASVVGGLASCPVIAVPTSVGYGAHFGGISALLAMLNSCASNVSVVNIDNGFGAAFQASMINHLD